MSKNKLKISLIYAVLLCLLGLAVLSSCSSVTIDRSRLDEALENKLSEELYTASSYADYKTAYEEALALSKKENISVLEIDKAVDNLNAAKAKLTARADFSELKKQISIFKTIDQNEYAPSSYEVYFNAYLHAMAVSEVDSSTQSEINAAAAAMDDAKKALQKLPDTSVLRALISTQVDQSLYTGASYSAYKSAVDKAVALLEEECPSIESIKVAENMLRETFAALVKRGSGEHTASVIEHIKKDVLVPDASGRPANEHFSSKSYALLIRAISKAEAVLATSDASEKDYEDIERELQDCVEELVDISVLLDAYDLAGRYSTTIDTGEFTADSYKRLSDAMDKCYHLMMSADVTADEVQNAAKELNDVISNMERVTVTPDGKLDKPVKDHTLKVGNAEVTISDFLSDYSVFFLDMINLNADFTYRPENDVVVFTKDHVQVKIAEKYLEVSYTGGAPVSHEDLALFSLDGDKIRFDAHLLTLITDAYLGSPTDYTLKKEVIGGAEKDMAIISYTNEEDGVTMRVKINADDKYIVSIVFDARTAA